MKKTLYILIVLVALVAVAAPYGFGPSPLIATAQTDAGDPVVPEPTPTAASVKPCGTLIPGVIDIFLRPIDCGPLPAIANAILTIMSYALKVTAAFFDLSMQFTLNISERTKLLGIQDSWVVVRDLLNIVFIFVILWIAIKTILQLGDDRKLLGSIIISALLINFSLFFTQVIIDSSNVIAFQFYNGITGGNTIDAGISDQFMEKLQLTTIFKDPGTKNGLDFLAILSISVFGSIFILITAVVFFLAGLMFLARTVVLIFLMVVSPIGFVGAWVPRLGEYSGKWWNALINQSLVAPVFLLFIWIILKMTEGSGLNALSGATPSAGGFSAAIAGSGGASGIIFYFALFIALIITALKITKSLSGEFGNSFTSFGQKAVGMAVGGVGGFMGRQFLGRGAAFMARQKGFQELATEDSFRGRMAMRALQLTDKAAKGSFDVRGASLPGAGAILKTAGAGIDLGKAGGKGGFAGAIDERKKAREAQAKLIEFKETKEEGIKRKAEFEKTQSAEARKYAEEEIKNKYPNISPVDLVQATGKSHEELVSEYSKRYVEKEGGTFKTAKQITASNKESFVAQIKGTPKMVSMPASIRGDIEAADKINKSTEELSKLEADVDKIETKLKDLLKKAGLPEEITVGNIEEAVEKLTRESNNAVVLLESDVDRKIDLTKRIELIEKKNGRETARRLEALQKQRDDKKEKLEKMRGGEPKPKEEKPAGGGEEKKP
ncbi:MAG: hypothetical protein AAB355_02330 [Patescibacteria group bacterium]